MTDTEVYLMLANAGHDITSARMAEARALQRARVLAVDAVNVGVSEKRAAELLQVDRMTVRKWLGKR